MYQQICPNFCQTLPIFSQYFNKVLQAEVLSVESWCTEKNFSCHKLQKNYLSLYFFSFHKVLNAACPSLKLCIKYACCSPKKWMRLCLTKFYRFCLEKTLLAVMFYILFIFFPGISILYNLFLSICCSKFHI